MSLNEGQMKILNLIADKANGNINAGVYSNRIAEDSSLPPREVNEYLSQLSGLGLITIGPKASGADFVLVNLTREGFERSTWSREHRLT